LLSLVAILTECEIELHSGNRQQSSGASLALCRLRRQQRCAKKKKKAENVPRRDSGTPEPPDSTILFSNRVD
jgi:hypothetical protein